MRRYWGQPAYRRSSSDPAARASTAGRSSSRPSMSSRAVTRSAYWYRTGAQDELGTLRAFPEYQPWLETVPPGVAFVAHARALSGNFPPGSVMAARRAPHHHSVALEMQYGIVTVEGTDDLTETSSHPGHEACCWRCLWRNFCRCRKLLGIVRNHSGVSL